MSESEKDATMDRFLETELPKVLEEACLRLEQLGCSVVFLVVGQELAKWGVGAGNPGHLVYALEMEKHQILQRMLSECTTQNTDPPATEGE